MVIFSHDGALRMSIHAKILASLALAAGLSVTTANAASIVTNGGFETGDFTGWTPNAVSYPMYIVTSPVSEGQYAAQIAGYGYGPDTLSQTLTTTAAQNYNLTFDLYQVASNPNGFSVSWDGITLYSDTDNPHNYLSYSFSVVGTGSDTLLFTDYNTSAFTYLDNVSVSAASEVPEASTWMIMIGGFAALGFVAHRRKSRRALDAA